MCVNHGQFSTILWTQSLHYKCIFLPIKFYYIAIAKPQYCWKAVNCMFKQIFCTHKKNCFPKILLFISYSLLLHPHLSSHFSLLWPGHVNPHRGECGVKQERMLLGLPTSADDGFLQHVEKHILSLRTKKTSGIQNQFQHNFLTYKLQRRRRNSWFCSCRTGVSIYNP